jgi:hypothetical protein
VREVNRYLDKFVIREQTLPQTTIQEVAMNLHHLIHSCSFLQLINHLMPLGLDHFNGHVVIQIVHEVEHAVTEDVRATEQPMQIHVLQALQGAPGVTEFSLHETTVKQVPKLQLVLGQCSPGQHDAQWPFHFVIQCEHVIALRQRYVH